MKKETKIQKEVQETSAVAVIDRTLTDDVKTSLLVVSVMVNLFIFTSWLVLQSTNQYDQQIIGWLFTR